MVLSIVALELLGGAVGAVPAGPSTWAEATPAVKPDPAREHLAAVEKRFQNDLYALIVSKWPQLKAIAATQRDLAIALIDRRTIEYYYVRDHHPGKIVRNQDAAAFANFDLSSADQQALRASNAAYVALGQRIDQLQQKFQNSPEAADAQAKFPAIRSDPRYPPILARLQQGLREVEQLLKKTP